MAINHGRPSQGESVVLASAEELMPWVEESVIDLTYSSLPPEQSRIAIWEIDPEGARQSHEPSGAAQGYHFLLPWQEVQPVGDRLQLHLRLQLSDGRTLVSQRELRGNGTRSDPGSSVWVPRSPTLAPSEESVGRESLPATEHVVPANPLRSAPLSGPEAGWGRR